MGGLFTLEDTSLLTTVFEKVESVLLARNLKSYRTRKHRKVKDHGYQIGVVNTYSHEQVVIKICALCVCLVLILDSSSLD